VADALALSLSGEEKKRLGKSETENVGAYQLYLTGRYHWNILTPPELTKSISFFQQAIDVDPSYALAYFGLAEAYRSLSITGDMRPQDVLPQAKAAAMKAVELDGLLAEPHASLVFIRMWYDWDWVGAEKDAKRALELNPNSGEAHMAYAALLSDLGRHQEAVAQAARARELDPVSLIINTIEGAILYFARRDDEADARLQKALELNADFWIAHLFRGKIYLQKGEYREAIAEFSKAKEVSRGNSEAISMLGYVWAVAGDAAKAHSTLDELKSPATPRYIPPFNIAVVYLGLGERDECFASLEKAYQDHDVRLSLLKVDPKWDAVRSDPRFISILKRIGLD
jgi:serine/threonine-protein kinase